MTATVTVVSPSGSTETRRPSSCRRRSSSAKVNVPLIHQVVVAQQAAARQGTHATKNRGDVRGGGKKPYRQKGTGRARQGSIRAPQFAGGGVVHGPVPRSYEQRTPKKMKAAALRGALSDRAAHGRVHVVSRFIDGDEPRTKDALVGAVGRGRRADVGRPGTGRRRRERRDDLEEPAQRARRAPDRLRPAQHLRRAGQRPCRVHRGGPGRVRGEAVAGLRPTACADGPAAESPAAALSPPTPRPRNRSYRARGR